MVKRLIRFHILLEGDIELENDSNEQAIEDVLSEISLPETIGRLKILNPVRSGYASVRLWNETRDTLGPVHKHDGNKVIQVKK